VRPLYHISFLQWYDGILVATIYNDNKYSDTRGYKW